VRSALVTVLAFPLLMLLVLTTPTGTGEGVHRALLLHPLFTHTHVVNGQVVTHDQASDHPTDASINANQHGGLALGAGAGATLVSDVSVSSPVVPLLDLRLEPDTDLRPTRSRPHLPSGRVEAPPDPPPTLTA